MASSASRLGRRNKPAPPAQPEPVERVAGPAAMPWLPPPASFAPRNLVPAPGAAAVERARGSVALSHLPPPATFARRLGPASRLAPPNPSPPVPQGRPGPAMPPHSAASSSSSTRRRNRGREAVEGQGARDWAALPRDALGAILRKLGHVEILKGPRQVCRSWRRAARDDPELWRRIDMRGHADLHRRFDLCRMAQDAIRRAKGQCEAFWAEYAADDYVLQLLGEQAPSLKSLHLISCQNIIRFEEEIKKFPLLEELEISLFTNIGGKCEFFVVGQACRKLKHFSFNRYRFLDLGNREYLDGDDYDAYECEYSNDDALGIATMHGLRTLQLFANNLTNEGLATILDNCPHLESLDIRHCFNIIMDDTLQAKCARIKTLKLPYDSTDDYGFPVCSPVWSVDIDSDSDTFVSSGVYSDSDDYGDYILDSDEYNDYYDPYRYLNGVYEDELGPEDRMLLKTMRLLMKEDDEDDGY